MYLTIERKGEQPVFRQIMDAVVRRIRSGELTPGSRLPTVRAVAWQPFRRLCSQSRTLPRLGDRAPSTAGW